MRTRSGFTLLEVTVALAMATYVAAIGFVGVIAFGRSISRSARIIGETSMITAVMRESIKAADGSATAAGAASVNLGTLGVPSTWPACAATSVNAAGIATTPGGATFTKISFTIANLSDANARTGGSLDRGLNMARNGNQASNTLWMQALPCF